MEQSTFQLSETVTTQYPREPKMESLLSKISAYHLISYALTGLLLTSCYVVLHGLSPSFGTAVTFGAVYLVGLLVSRIGSVLMESPLKKIGFIQYAEYPDFVEAENIDSKVSCLLYTSPSPRDS